MISPTGPGDRGAERGDPTEALVRAAREGDSEAFGRLVELHQRAATRLAYRILRDVDDADGATQDAFVKAWSNLRSFRSECPFGAWLSRIVVNECRDRLKRSRLVVAESRLERTERAGERESSPLDLSADSAPDPESRAVGRELGRVITGEVGRLPKMQREVFSLRFFEDRPLAEIARLFRVDVGTVKTHLFRATHRIRKAIEERYGPRLPIR